MSSTKTGIEWTAFFFKQHGGRTPKAGGSQLFGKEYKEFPDA